MYSRNTKTTNEPTASNNKSERPQVKIWDTWKTLKYLNINENRKDVDQYKFVVLSLLIVVLFGFLNIKSVKIYTIPYIFATTLLLNKLDTLLLKQKNLPVFYIQLGLHLSTHAEKETHYLQYGPLLLFQ